MNYELSKRQKAYLKNKDKHKLQMKEYYQKRKDSIEFQEYSKKRRLEYRENHPERILFLSAKNRAKKLNLDFTLELSDIVIPEKCPYLDIPITRITGSGKIDTNPSLDRIDSSKGYVKGNVQVISLLANRMKQNASTEQLVSFAEGVLRLLKPPITS